jgi:vacuolar-type H+-ATPase subunit H
MNMQNGHRRPEEIEASIQRTRTDLDETLTQLEHSLTPGQLIDQGMDYLRHSSAREYLTNLSAASKRDPIPLALVGVGLAWLMMSGRREPDTGHPADHAQGMGDAARSAGYRASEMGESARDKMHEFTDSARHKAHELGDSARQTASHLRDSARAQGERLRSGYEQVVDEQPLVLGAVGLAIGAVFAAMVPRTQQEDRLLGTRSGKRSDRGAGKDALEPEDRWSNASSRPSSSVSDDSAGSMRATAASTAGSVVPDGPGGLSSGPETGSADLFDSSPRASGLSGSFDASADDRDRVRNREDREQDNLYLDQDQGQGHGRDRDRDGEQDLDRATRSSGSSQRGRL